MERKRDPVILIVDDEKSLLDHLEAYLHEAGYTSVKTALSLAQARFQLANHQVDLMILDLMLPDGSGMDLLKSVRERSDIPVIILSALDGINDRREGFESEADDYIVKPFLAEDLLWRIEAVLRRSFHDDKDKIFDLNSINYLKEMFLMKMQLIKFLTIIQPQYLFNIIEIILLILILNKLKELFKEM